VLPLLLAAWTPLVVISIDGLDHRYLRDRDQLSLQIPNLRRMLRQGAWADGVVGVYPTLTWPSHTSIVTGVTPDEHGILDNRRPAAEGGDYYWSADLIKVPTLWQAAERAGWKTAAITWPVTVDAGIDLNLPAFFQPRSGGPMDLASIQSKATPGLVARISAWFPSFPQSSMEDRTRVLAALYMLRFERPDLLLIHLTDHDGEAHAKGPFTREANAVLEYTDELVGRILAVLPKTARVAIVSDHGFERTDKIMNMSVLLERQGIKGTVQSLGGIIVTDDAPVAAFLRKVGADPDYTLGREIPIAEWKRFAPNQPEHKAVFEAAEHFWFGRATVGDLFETPQDRGSHGFWPLRQDYRATFLLWGAGIKPERLPEMDMLEVAPRLAGLLDIDLKRERQPAPASTSPD
jgi:predicted AlkP superfamily pyrophosphatase or phosphodiesterase